MTRVDETAFAKINLDLRICGRRADGYNLLDSLVVFAEAGDHLSFEPSDKLSLSIEGPFGQALPDDDDNLVIRAATALARLTGRKANVHITLEKTLPIASGLGGGSADAAATLRGLTRLWSLPMGLSDLLPLAEILGADVPVCLGAKAAHMQGIGETLTPLTGPADLPMLLVNPGKPVSTADVFRALGTFSGPRDRAAFDQTDHGFRDHLIKSVNDLEEPAIRIEPVISSVLDILRRQPGCTLARMSGSGATCFSLFDHPAERDLAVSSITSAHPHWWVIGTRIR